MVEKELIIKVFTDVIGKCSRHRGGRLSCPNSVKRLLDEFSDRMQNTPFEFMEWYTEDGLKVFENKGDATSVEWDIDDMEDVVRDEYFDLYVEHSHPDVLEFDGKFVSFENIPTCLSWEDINNLWTTTEYEDYSSGELKDIEVTPFKGVIADCNNGTRMSLIRNTGDGKNNHILSDDGSAYKKFKETYPHLQKDYRQFCKDYVDSTNKHMGEWCENKITTLKNSGGVNGRWSEEDYREEKLRYGKSFSQEHFHEYIDDDIKEFDKIGFDLSVEWVR